jgi:hypothetical protein
MATDIYIANSKDEIFSGKIKPSFQLEEEEWVKLYNLMEPSFDDLALIKNIFQYFYGAEGSTLISYESLNQLALEIDKSQVNHPFLERLKLLIEKARQNNSGIYFAAD